jgi:hypothetical protein
VGDGDDRRPWPDAQGPAAPASAHPCRWRSRPRASGRARRRIPARRPRLPCRGCTSRSSARAPRRRRSPPSARGSRRRDRPGAR